MRYVIETFRNKALEELHKTGETGGINKKFHERVVERLDALEAAIRAEDMNIPGYDFHQLKGKEAGRYSVHVNGPWCITFEFHSGNAYRVDFEQYH